MTVVEYSGGSDSEGPIVVVQNLVKHKISVPVS